MRITNKDVFKLNDTPCELCCTCTETGEMLNDVLWFDTDTGEYEKYVMGADGKPMVDALGGLMTKKVLALQFFFTLTPGPRKDLGVEMATIPAYARQSIN